LYFCTVCKPFQIPVSRSSRHSTVARPVRKRFTRANIVDIHGQLRIDEAGFVFPRCQTPRKSCRALLVTPYTSTLSPGFPQRIREVVNSIGADGIPKGLALVSVASSPVPTVV
jgi:hypothetical protein